MPHPDTDAIEALLPQTQCTRCGYSACRPYAEAVATGAAAINRCVPGGEALIARLAQLTGSAPLPLDPSCGFEAPARLAWIDADTCIGCARCLPACPVDAIIGAARLLHTVIPSWCTGCELCLPACPVDCIRMLAWPAELAAPAPGLNRERHAAHQARLAARSSERAAQVAALKSVDSGAP
jgi:electron transport complex protein RnfB